ncbi:hypothetical protein PoB_003245100 [Plakobranchus ocellatus]|uniref:Uncharacterized protein n=1 Tax=Plakobranchus ocellatus TaxID=259542 RepID=A0AAV4AC49_9GAST|nr:hypothetical protein PoB_003245100 [Plakobranchus ocellatus]
MPPSFILSQKFFRFLERFALTSRPPAPPWYLISPSEISRLVLGGPRFVEHRRVVQMLRFDPHAAFRGSLPATPPPIS